MERRYVAAAGLVPDKGDRVAQVPLRRRFRLGASIRGRRRGLSPVVAGAAISAAALGDPSRLEWLSFFGNSLTGPVPEALGDLSGAVVALE